MYIHIFRQETQTDFKRIEIFVVGFQNKSIDIKNGKEIVTLSWYSEYSISNEIRQSCHFLFKYK